MRYIVWEYDDVQNDQTWPPGSWEDLQDIAIYRHPEFVVVYLKGEEYRQLRLRARDYFYRRNGSTNVSTAEKAKRLVSSIKRDPVGMVRAATPDTVRRRLVCCAGCEWCDPLQLGCKICGCKFKQKLTRAAHSCPISEWKIADGLELTDKEQAEREKELAKAREKYNGKRRQEKTTGTA